MLGPARCAKNEEMAQLCQCVMSTPSSFPSESFPDSLRVSFTHHFPLLFPQVATAPPGTQAASLDVEGAYRTIPILPDHKRYLVVRYRDLFYMDHNLPFSAASAAGLQDEVADATQDIWEYTNISPSWKWVDDFFLIRVPNPDGPFVGVSNGITYRYRYDLHSAKEYISPINIPWHPTKGAEFGDVCDYVGYTFDFPNRSVSLPEAKRIKYHFRTLSFFLAYEE